MKLNCGPTWYEKVQQKKQWHRWFAWRPVRVGPRDCRWLEYVERKGDYMIYPECCGWDWEYRAIQQKEIE